MSGGAETRATILPSVEPRGIGFLGPDYQFDEELITPRTVGVRRQGSIGAVFDAVKGVAYYMDTVAFGQASSGLTSGMPFKKYGTNYFLNTGSKCSNGANMFHYMELIPKGNAFGKVGAAIAEVGGAPLQGLAPGAIEDIKAAVDLGPAMKSMFGTGYPKCRLQTLPVGDMNKQIVNPDSRNPWVDDPSAVRDCMQMPDGTWTEVGPYSGINTRDPSFKIRACQTKWTLDRMVNKAEYNADKKTHNSDGTPIRQTIGPVRQTTESFISASTFEDSNGHLLLILGAVIAANFWAYSRR